MTSITHGSAHRGRKTVEYSTWVQLRGRCNNPNDKAYGYYGARGIKVCDRWNSFANFLADMGPRPGKGYSIERNNNDVGYNPDNCRWIPKSEQAANRRNNVMLEVDGKQLNFAEACRTLGFYKSRIHARWKRLGWSLEEAFEGRAKPIARSM